MTTKRITERYDTGNLTAASIIASNPVAYPEGSLAAQWADMILSKAAHPDDAEAGPLFAKVA
jgi:hypothetical protein